jgi:ribulose-phosphate 3-epimerase
MSHSRIEIIPAIMPKNLEEIEEKMTAVDPHVQWVQLDIMDGEFVQNFSWPYTEESFSKGHLHALRSVLLEHASLAVEVDLMIAHPEEEAEMWILAGARRVIFHHESLKGKLNFLKDIKKRYPMIQYGIAILPHHDVSVLEQYIPYVDYVQCMGIDHIGRQGEAFNESVPQLIESIRAHHPKLTIAVDGGVSDVTAQKIKDAGATHLVSGSFIFGSADVHSAVQKLYDGVIY